MSSFRGRSFAREDLRVGSRVVGGNVLLSGRIGRVKEITGQGSTRRYFVEWEDGNTYPVIDVEISSASHPFYTGKQRILDSAGRVEKFNQRFKNFGK